jgi:hypothetical protein
MTATTVFIFDRTRPTAELVSDHTAATGHRGPPNLPLFDSTTQQPASCPPPHPASCASPVLPERSHCFELGVTRSPPHEI